MKMESKNPLVYVDMDGVVADFVGKYKECFGRCAVEDGIEEASRICSTVPEFFSYLESIPKGIELVKWLTNNEYEVVFLTTPIPEMERCTKDKIAWIRRKIGDGYSVIFAKNKARYVESDKDILIDDMSHNLIAWEMSGGVAINFAHDLKEIKRIVRDTHNSCVGG